MKIISKLGVMLSLVSLAYAGGPKISPDLRMLDPDSTVDVIVQYKHAPTAAHHKKIADKGGSHGTLA